MTNTTALTRLSQRLALVTALVGGVVILGWMSDQPSWLIHFLPSWVSMKFNTALGFVVAGVALQMRHRSQHITVGYRIAAISLMLLGLLTLIEYGLAINLGIDEWLVHDQYALQSADAGRMPPICAVCFLLLGGILLLDSTQLAHHKRLLSGLALSISVISGMYILGYAYHVESFTTNTNLSTMPLHTAILFFLLSFSALSLHPEHPLLSAATIPQAKNLFMMILLIPVVSWLRLDAQERFGLYDDNTGVAFMTLFFMVSWLIVVVRSMNTIHEQHLQIQKQHLLHQSILCNMSEGVIVVDPKHAFQVLNPAAEEILGKVTTADATSLHELYGVFYPNTLQRYKVEDYPVIQALKGAFIDDEVQFIRNRLRPEGRYINVSARPITNEAGAIVGAVAVLHDISEIRRVSEALLKAANDERSLSQELNVLNNKLRIYSEEIAYKNQQLEHVSQMKSEFLANMSHELRTPLNAIIGFSEILKDGVVGELSRDQTSYVTEIFDSGEHLLSLINDILDLSKVEAGMMTLDISLVEVVNLLQSSLSVIKEKALKNGIKLTLDVENAPAHIMADGRKLKQIVYNLLSNAIKFTTEHGEIRLVAKIVGRDARQ
jgi:PAS domain S-box-containing protein